MLISFKIFSLPILLVLFLVFFWLHHVAYGILVPQPGIDPWPTAVKVPSPNHWTAGDFPPLSILKRKSVFFLFYFSLHEAISGTGEGEP